MPNRVEKVKGTIRNVLHLQQKVMIILNISIKWLFLSCFRWRRKRSGLLDMLWSRSQRLWSHDSSVWLSRRRRCRSSWLSPKMACRGTFLLLYRNERTYYERICLFDVFFYEFCSLPTIQRLWSAKFVPPRTWWKKDLNFRYHTDSLHVNGFKPLVWSRWCAWVWEDLGRWSNCILNLGLEC